MKAKTFFFVYDSEKLKQEKYYKDFSQVLIEHSPG